MCVRLAVLPRRPRLLSWHPALRSCRTQSVWTFSPCSLKRRMQGRFSLPFSRTSLSSVVSLHLTPQLSRKCELLTQISRDSLSPLPSTFFSVLPSPQWNNGTATVKIRHVTSATVAHFPPFGCFSYMTFKIQAIYDSAFVATVLTTV